MTYQLVTTTVSGVTFPGIQCLLCLRTSYNRYDIAERYCGACHVFHEDPSVSRGTPDTVGPVGVSDPVVP